MPQGDPLLQFIRGMTVDELNAIRRRCDWCRVQRTDTKRELSKRIRDSINRSVTNGELTYEQAMRDIRLQVLIPGPESVEQTIRRTLRDTAISTRVGEIRLVEEWFSAQLFGALDAQLVSPYRAYIEHELNHQTRSRADIYIRDHGGHGDFLIEVKRDTEIENGNHVIRQLRKYHRDIAAHPDLHHRMTFLCVISEPDGSAERPEREQQTLSQMTAVPSTLDDIENEFDYLELVVNRFNST